MTRDRAAGGVCTGGPLPLGRPVGRALIVPGRRDAHLPSVTVVKKPKVTQISRESVVSGGNLGPATRHRPGPCLVPIHHTAFPRMDREAAMRRAAFPSSVAVTCVWQGCLARARRPHDAVS